MYLIPNEGWFLGNTSLYVTHQKVPKLLRFTLLQPLHTNMLRLQRCARHVWSWNIYIWTHVWPGGSESTALLVVRVTLLLFSSRQWSPESFRASWCSSWTRTCWSTSSAGWAPSPPAGTWSSGPSRWWCWSTSWPLRGSFQCDWMTSRGLRINITTQFRLHAT